MYGALAGAAINVRGVETARPTAAAHDGQSGFDYLLLIEREGARPRPNQFERRTNCAVCGYTRGQQMEERTMKALAVLTIAVIATAAVYTQSQKQTAAGTAAVTSVADRYAKAVLAADAKAVAALYTADAVEMPPNQPTVKGRSAIQQYYEKLFGAGKTARFTLTHLETQAAGDTAYDVGTYQQSIMPAGAAGMDDTGKYVVILKRVDGEWRVAYAIYNSDRPAR